MLWTILLACAQEPPPPAECPLWYADLDADGFGDPSDPVASCEPVSGRVDNGNDCDDRDAALTTQASCSQSCSQAPLVRATELEACEGALIRVNGRLEGLPEGACVCEVSELLLADDHTDPASVAALIRVDTLAISEDAGDLSFDNLEEVQTLTAVLSQTELSLERLRSAQEIYIQGASQLRLPALKEAERLLLLELGAESLTLPALDEVEYMVVQDAALRSLSLGPRADVVWLRIANSDALALISGGREISLMELHRRQQDVQRTITSPIRDLWWWGQHRADVVLTAGPDRTLRKVGSGTLSVQHSEQSTLWVQKGTLMLPTQQEARYLWLEGGQLDAPMLTHVDTLSGSGGCDLPALETADYVYAGSDCDPPRLRWVGTLRGVGTLSAVESVDTHNWGNNVVLPSLREATGVGTIWGAEGALPELSLVSGDLQFDGAVLPKLRHVDGELVVLNGLVELPALQSTDGLQVTGWREVRVDQDWDFPVRVEGFDGSLQMGRVNAAVVVRNQGDSAKRAAPHLAFDEIHGNVTVVAILWETVDIRIGELDGDLLYCIPRLTPEQAQAWVDSIPMTGTATDICTW
ncbi:MAG: hypothetical protein VX899_02205 [Myxococcota bacterium]|nr:hypothetical protein [Myxococcota bacterium]